MAIIGFLLITSFGSVLVLGGLLLVLGSYQLSGRVDLSPLMLAVIGGAILYWSCHNAPFTISLVTP